MDIVFNVTKGQLLNDQSLSTNVQQRNANKKLHVTRKYFPQWPDSVFISLEKARSWVDKFVAWYNGEHRHSGIRYVTPNERHDIKHDNYLEKLR
jgi:transposase InsO family protein